jgi:hypothetical protein
MNQKLLAWFQVISNIGILVGLLLVGLQLKQASEIAEAELISDGLLSTMGALEMLAGDEQLTVAWRKAMQNSPDLTDDELVAVAYFLIREFTSAARLEALRDRGFNEGPDDSTIDKWVFGYLGNDTSLRWWHGEQNVVRRTNRPLYEAIDAKLSEQGANHRTLHARALSEWRGNTPEDGAQ